MVFLPPHVRPCASAQRSSAATPYNLNGITLSALDVLARGARHCISANNNTILVIQIKINALQTPNSFGLAFVTFIIYIEEL